MYGEPSIVVLDEPNSNLDDVGEAALMRAVQDLKAQGRTVFLITHRLNILGVTDALLLLNDGAIIQHGPTREVIAALQARAAPVNAAPSRHSGEAAAQPA